MPASRRVGLLLVVGLALGCSTTSVPSVTPTIASPSPLVLSVPSPEVDRRFRHEVIAGPNVAGAFDLATDGTVIAWSSGRVDVDAPDLWTFDPARGETALVYRSATRGAILSNLAVRRGTYAFAEVRPKADGSRTWRLDLLGPTGQVHVLDTNDVPADQTGILPMSAISDRGVLWATSHAGDAASLRCELRYASLADLRPWTVRAEPCSAVELWYPRSDGRSFVYGTVEYGPEGSADDRHVYLVTDTTLDQPRRLDVDGEASLPAILDDAVVWKAAPRDLNAFSPAGLLEISLTGPSAARALPFPGEPEAQLMTPSIGPAFVVADDAGGGSVEAWDRRREVGLVVDRLDQADPGFLSGARLAGDLLAWFYTSSTAGGGTREVRWLWLPPG